MCIRDRENSIGVITAICPYVGYETAANIAKEALRTGRQVRDLILEKMCIRDRYVRQIDSKLVLIHFDYYDELKNQVQQVYDSIRQPQA